MWAKVIGVMVKRHRESGANGESPMASLIYPLTQIALGTAGLIPTPRLDRGGGVCSVCRVCVVAVLCCRRNGRF